jgi:hypothetical protein
LPGVGESGAAEDAIYRDIADYLERFLQTASAQIFRETSGFRCFEPRPGPGAGRLHVTTLIFNMAPDTRPEGADVPLEIQVTVEVDLDGRGN